MYDEDGMPHYVYEEGNCTKDSAKGKLLKALYREGFEPFCLEVLLSKENLPLLMEVLQERAKE